MESTDTLRLTGLDGSNPLGFLAALGLLRILDHQASITNTDCPRLHWVEDGYWYPVLHGQKDIEEVIETVMDDKISWVHDIAFRLAYDETGQRLVDPGAPNAIRDLKPKPAVMRAFLDRVATIGSEESMTRESWLFARRSMDTAAAYGSELIQDRTKGNTKPLALHFAAGQQSFLDAASKLREGISHDDVLEALIGPWKGQSKLPSMSWDATIARVYALRASDPSAEKRGSTAGADWLAFVALGLLLVTPRGRDLVTAGVRGGWKNSAFTWALWDGPMSVAVVRSILAMKNPSRLRVDERKARGISVVFSSAITRSDQGGYGSFAPSGVV